MTTEGSVAGLERGTQRSPGALASDYTRALTACDALLGEVGRRGHMFAWLRAPERGGWLPVDAYYPGNRVVVVCRARPEDHDELLRHEVAQHGLRLLELGEGELDGSPEARARIARLVGALQALRAAPAPGSASSAPSAPARQGQAGFLLAGLAPPAAGTVRPVRVRRGAGTHAAPDPNRGVLVGGGVFVGIVLAVALFAESYAAVLALGASEVLLAFGLALDIIARGLGAVAAARARSAAWLWSCVVLGSLAVAASVLRERTEPLPEPAPLAGLLSLLALVVLALALLSGALGG